YFEKPQFENGTKKILTAIANTNALTILGGGHTSMAAKKYGLTDKLSHISTGGGAFILFMTGTPLPGIDALFESAKKYRDINTQEKIIVSEGKL
ncbi:MAG: phosphoglycerate kinase, partial [Candidatus Aenigmarchaeota archaeon]|nr:phosphoglycerate kinase [Candidatus Aenigmarchaeota archaeon]